MAWMWSVFSKTVSLVLKSPTLCSISHQITGTVKLNWFLGAVYFLWNMQFKGCGEKKIERISLEGELSWVAGRKNRRAPNRCSYLTFPTSAHFIQTSSTQSHHDHHCCLHLWYICFPSVSKDLCGPRSSSPTNHTNSFCSKTLSWYLFLLALCSVSWRVFQKDLLKSRLRGQPDQWLPPSPPPCPLPWFCPSLPPGLHFT